MKKFHYFGMNNPIFVFTDAHKTRLCLILTQGSFIEEAKPVVTVTGKSNVAEKNYPQVELEATVADFTLRRFNN